MQDLFERGLDRVSDGAEIEPQSAGAPAPVAKRGRPKGAKNKASGDLLKWIKTEAGGVTPGQQLAKLGMVSPREIRLGKAWLKANNDKRINIKGLDPVVIGMAYKATQLAALMGWDKRDAWSAIHKAASDLLPYVHQKQASVEAAKPDNKGVIVVDGAVLGAHGNPSQGIDNQQDFFIEALMDTQDQSRNGQKSLDIKALDG